MEEKHTLKEYDELATKTINDIKSFFSKVINHSALAFSFTTIILIIFLYFYEMGYLNVFGIPVKYISINIQNYIAVLYVSLTYIMIVLIWTIVYLVEKTYTSSNLNIKELSTFFVIYFNMFYGAFKSSLLPLIFMSLVITAITNTIIKLWQKGHFRLRKHTPKQMSGYKFVEGKLSYFITNECCTILILSCITMLYNIGDFMARNQTKYEIISYDSQPYVVISEHKNYSIIQNAEIHNDELRIDTTSYRLISKENIEIEYKEFEKVTFKGVK